MTPRGIASGPTSGGVPTARGVPGRGGRRERAAAGAGAAVALAALAVLALRIGDLIGPDLDDLADAAAELAGLALFGIGCWLVPAARRWAGPAPRRPEAPPGSGAPGRRRPGAQ